MCDGTLRCSHRSDGRYNVKKMMSDMMLKNYGRCLSRNICQMPCEESDRGWDIEKCGMSGKNMTYDIQKRMVEVTLKKNHRCDIS